MENESAFKILIPETNFQQPRKKPINQQTFDDTSSRANRGQLTKSLLQSTNNSGLMRQNFMASQPSKSFIPMSNFPSSLQQQQQQHLPFFNQSAQNLGPFLQTFNHTVDNSTSRNNINSQMNPVYRNPTNVNPNNMNQNQSQLMMNFNQSLPGFTTAPTSNLNPNLNTTSNIFNYEDILGNVQKSYSRSKHSHHHHRGHRHSSSRRHHHRSSDKSSKYSTSKYRSIFDKYGVAFSDSESTDSRSYISESENSRTSIKRRLKGLSSSQRRAVIDVIKDYIPDDFQTMVHEDIVKRMEQLESKGYKLPDGYDKKSHSMEINEMKLFDQQVEKDRMISTKTASRRIKQVAQIISIVCSTLKIDLIKTDMLSSVINESLSEGGDFEEVLEVLGKKIRQTILSDPIVDASLTFIGKVYEAHEKSIEKEYEKLEEEEEKRERRQENALASLNQFRFEKNQKSANNNKNNNNISLDVPPVPVSTSSEKKQNETNSIITEKKNDLNIQQEQNKKEIVSENFQNNLKYQKEQVQEDCQVQNNNVKNQEQKEKRMQEEKKNNSTHEDDEKHVETNKVAEKKVVQKRKNKKSFKKMSEIQIPESVSTLLGSMNKPINQLKTILSEE
jgi:hypothetical protein